MKTEFTKQLSFMTSSLEQQLVDLLLRFYEHRELPLDIARLRTEKEFEKSSNDIGLLKVFILSAMENYTDLQYPDKAALIYCFSIIDAAQDCLTDSRKLGSEQFLIQALGNISSIPGLFSDNKVVVPK